MNDFYKGVILSILRKALTGVSAWAITNGWLTGDQATEITLGIAGLIVSVCLSLWDQYKTQLTKLSALTPGITTLDEAKALAKAPSAPSVTTPSDVTPTVPTPSDVWTAQNVMKAPAWFIAAALGGAVLASGCGGQPVNLRPAAIASETFSVALKGLQAQFVVWGDAGTVSRDTEREWQAAFKQLAQVGLAVDAAIRTGDHANIAANAQAALGLVDELIRVNVIKLNPGQRGAVAVALQSIRGFIAIWQVLQPPATAAATIGSHADLVAIAEG